MAHIIPKTKKTKNLVSLLDQLIIMRQSSPSCWSTLQKKNKKFAGETFTFFLSAKFIWQRRKSFYKKKKKEDFENHQYSFADKRRKKNFHVLSDICILVIGNILAISFNQKITYNQKNFHVVFDTRTIKSFLDHDGKNR